MDLVLAQMRKAGRAAFSTREYTALRRKGAYARLVLHRLKKRGELALVRRGKWAFPDAMHEAIACEISQPCYLSFFSALNLHGLTTQIPRIIQLAVARNASTYEVMGTPVKEYKVKREHFNNFHTKEGLLLASPEKAFADCLNVPRACPLSILVEAAEGVDLAKVRELLTKNGSKRLEEVLKHVRQERT